MQQVRGDNFRSPSGNASVLNLATYADGAADGEQKSTRLKSASQTQKSKRKNPSLQFRHIHSVTFHSFIRHIAHNFHNDRKARVIFDAIQPSEQKEQAQEDEAGSEHVLRDVLLENTHFDIIEERSDDAVGSDDFDENKYADEDEEEMAKNEDEAARKLKRARFEVLRHFLVHI